MKAAVIVLSDPKNGSEEALGRLFNALATTWEFKQRGDSVRLLFQGAGTRWPGELQKSSHPARELYRAVADRVEGVSCGCADVFGARTAADAAGVACLRDNEVPGTSGLPSLRQLVADGYEILTF